MWFVSLLRFLKPKVWLTVEKPCYVCGFSTVCPRHIPPQIDRKWWLIEKLSLGDDLLKIILYFGVLFEFHFIAVFGCQQYLANYVEILFFVRCVVVSDSSVAWCGCHTMAGSGAVSACLVGRAISSSVLNREATEESLSLSCLRMRGRPQGVSWFLAEIDSTGTW